MKKNLVLAALISFGSIYAPDSESKSLSYDSLSVSFVNISIDNSDSNKSGYSFSASKVINDSLFVDGHYISMENDVEACFYSCSDTKVLQNEYSLGVGYRYAATDQITAFATASYIGVEFERAIDNDERGLGLAVGVRAMVSKRFELRGELITTEVYGASSPIWNAGVSYHTNENVSLGVNFRNEDGAAIYLFSAKYSF